MVDPVSTLLLAVEKEAAQLPGARLVAARAGARLPQRLAEACGRTVPPGVAAFLSRYDGGKLAPDVRILSFEEALAARRDPGRASELKGLWPIVERHGRLYALDSEFPGPDGEWSVVELADRSVDRAGTTLLRFLHALVIDLALPPDVDEILRASALHGARSGTGRALGGSGRAVRSGRASWMRRIGPCSRGCAAPARAGPALVMAAGAAGHRSRRAGDVARGARRRAGARAAHRPRRRRAAGRCGHHAGAGPAAGRSDGRRPARKELMGTASPSTGAFWRGEAIRALVGRPDASGGDGLRRGRRAVARGRGHPAPAGRQLLTRRSGVAAEGTRGAGPGRLRRGPAGRPQRGAGAGRPGGVARAAGRGAERRARTGWHRGGPAGDRAEPGPDRGVARAGRRVPGAAAGGQGRGGLPRAGAAGSRQWAGAGQAGPGAAGAGAHARGAGEHRDRRPSGAATRSS